MFEYRLNLYKTFIVEKLESILLKFKNNNSKFLVDAMEYSLFGGGKLLRPILTLAVCDMFGEDIKKAIYFSCAIEFMHVGSLVHDDLPCMDDDDFRRGVASCHIKYNEAAAVLAGDSFFCSAFEILTYSKEYGLADSLIVEAVGVLSRMFGVYGVIGGQDMDLFMDRKEVTEEIVRKVAIHKTASLIRAACRLGCIACGASNFEKKIIDEYATFFGLAFQICDDILDFDVKKENSKDNINFLYIYGYEEAKKKAIEYTNLAIERLKILQSSEFLIELTQRLLLRSR